MSQENICPTSDDLEIPYKFINDYQDYNLPKILIGSLIFILNPISFVLICKKINRIKNEANNNTYSILSIYILRILFIALMLVQLDWTINLMYLFNQQIEIVKFCKIITYVMKFKQLQFVPSFTLLLVLVTTI